MGIAWLLLGLMAFLGNDRPNWPEYGYLVIAILYLGGYIYENRNEYLIIENGLIYKRSLFPKRINLTDVNQIKKFGRGYILKTESEKMTINTQIIDEKSLMKLNLILGRLNMDPDKNPLATGSKEAK